MIVDTFLFAGEMDLLAIRMRELEGVVDHHVAIMGDQTFQGAARPLIDGFGDNITYVTVEVGEDAKPLQREARQRGYVDHLAERFPGDLILHGDVDEIPRAAEVRNADAFHGGPFRLRGDLHQHRLDWWLPDHADRGHHPFAGPVVATGAQVIDAGGAAAMRRDVTLPERLHSGWHLQWVMVPAECVHKVQTFAHPEYNRPPFTDEVFWQEHAAAGTDPLGRWTLEPKVVDQTFPRAVREAPDSWRHLMRPAWSAA